MTTKGDPAQNTVERIGAYRVVRRLATGGTSDVLLAKAEGPHGFERTVVLKVLLSHFGKDDDVARMFAREAAAYARLSHPAIVRLFDFFAVPAVAAEPGKPAPKDKGGQLVMVLEYVDGPPLARLKSMVKAIGKELDDKAAIYVATCIFAGLAAAHSVIDEHGVPAPVVHRDVNPSNVLIPWDGYAKLADFGVAKVTGLGHHSVVGMIKGTYGYMAPEQVTGGEAVTARSDVYAAGIILWELLTKRRAFQRGALPEIEALRAMAEPRLPALESIRSDVDRTVREALRRALEPRASSRKITAEEMVSILTGVVPLDQGRERLMAILGLVRNDARAANAQASIAPPAMAVPVGQSSPLDIVIPGSPKVADFGSVTMMGVAPPALQAPNVVASPSRMMAPPRPSSSRMPVATPVVDPAAPSARISSQKMPVAKPAPGSDLTVRELLSLPTRPAMPAVQTATTTSSTTATAKSAPFVDPPPQPIRAASRPQLAAVTRPPPMASDPPRRPSAAERLAGAVSDDDKRALESITPARPMSILDSLTDSLPPPSRMSSPPDSPRTAAPLKDLTGGLGLRDAIDEILKGSARMEAAKAAAAAAEGEDPKPVMRETTRVPADVAQGLIGQIPPAPAPMQADLASLEATAPPDAHVPPMDVAPPTPKADRASKDDFPNAHDDDPDAVAAETVIQPEPLPPHNTPRMTPVGAQTLAMESRPLPPPGTPGASGTTTTGAMPKFTPPPFAAAAPAPTPIPAPRSPSQEPPRQPTLPSHLEQRASAPPRMSSRPAPPVKKGVGVGAVAVGLVALIAVGIGGTVGFVRYQATRGPTQQVDAGVAPTARPTVSVVATPVPTPAVSATPSASVSASASSAPEPPASVSASASVSPPVVPPSASAGPSEPAPEGMGLVKTPNAAPGRRIFVDEKVIGQTPDTVSVKCGSHIVKLGSSGKPQTLDVPCGGEIIVSDPKP